MCRLELCLTAIFLGKNLGTSYDYKECGAPSVAKWGGSDETIKGPWCKDCLSDLAELEAELDCDHGTTDMSGRCTDCGLTEADQLNEREGGGWEDCPTCGVAIKIGGIGNEFCVRNCNEQRVWTILIDDNDAYSETFVFNSKKSAINFREAAMDSEYLQQQDIGVYNIVEQQVIDEEYPSDSYIADCLSIDCLKCGDECGCDE